MPRRLLKLLRLFWGTSLAAEAEYRANFVLALLSSLMALGGSLFGLFLFYRTGHALGGWSWEQALVVLGLYTVLDGVAATFLNPNLNRIVPHVQEGTLDFILLKPIDAQFWLSLRQLSLWGLPNLGFGLAILLYAGHRLGLGAGAALRALLFVPPAILLLYSLWFLLATLTIWFVKIYNITFVLKNVLEAGRYPINAYPGRLRMVLTFVVPVAFLTTVPARALLGQGGPLLFAGTALLAVALFAGTRVFWRFALRFYTSASS